MDQIDFTGPFEVLARLPESTFHVVWRKKVPIRDDQGLILTPEQTLAAAPPLDVLVIPGGPGQETSMDDEVVLAFIRDQAPRARYVFSVCTGASFAGGPACSKEPGQQHIGGHFTCSPISEPSRSTSGLFWMGSW